MINSPQTAPVSEPSYNDLVREIRQKDRRFRFFQGLFITIVLTGLIGIGLLALKQLSVLNQQAEIRSKNLQLLIEDNQRQTEYIKCIARFFNERNRATANLTDLDQCTIQRADGSTAAPDNVPPDTQTTSSTIRVIPPEQQPTVVVQRPEQTPPITVTPPETPVTPPVTKPDRNPVEVLGVPVCLPFTNVCVRH